MLLALQEAMVDPTETGRERAAGRALDAGFYIHCTKGPDGAPKPPLPMEPAGEADLRNATELTFKDGSSEP